MADEHHSPGAGRDPGLACGSAGSSRQEDRPSSLVERLERRIYELVYEIDPEPEPHRPFDELPAKDRAQARPLIVGLLGEFAAAIREMPRELGDVVFSAIADADSSISATTQDALLAVADWLDQEASR